jgi:hypothetical protein
MVEHLMDATVDFEGGKISAKGLGAPNNQLEYFISGAGLQIK